MVIQGLVELLIREPELVVVPVIFGIPSALLGLRMIFKHKERMASLRGPAQHTPDVAARLDQIERMVETIAVEMERIGEGQRFVTKLLADAPRLTQGAPEPPRLERVITPH